MKTTPAPTKPPVVECYDCAGTGTIWMADDLDVCCRECAGGGTVNRATRAKQLHEAREAARFWRWPPPRLPRTAQQPGPR